MFLFGAFHASAEPVRSGANRTPWVPLLRKGLSEVEVQGLVALALGRREELQRKLREEAEAQASQELGGLEREVLAG